MAKFHFYYIYGIPVENNLYNSLKIIVSKMNVNHLVDSVNLSIYFYILNIFCFIY